MPKVPGVLASRALQPTALRALGDHPKPAMKDRLKTGHQM